MTVLSVPYLGETQAASAESANTLSESLRDAEVSSGSVELPWGSVGMPAGTVALASGEVLLPRSPLAVPEILNGGQRRYQLNADLLFDFDKATLRDGAEVALRQLVDDVHQQVTRASFRIEGHTDALGSESYNLDLSQRRADSVMAWLSGPGGIPSDEITAVGRGESEPVAPNVTADGTDDPGGRQLNRRVEIIVSGAE